MLEKERLIVKKYVINACILLCILFINIAAWKMNTGQIYDARNLPSELCVENNERVATDESEKGCLVFGPYVEQEQGIIRVTVKYETDTEQNWVDVYSNKKQITFEKLYLSPNKNSVTFDVHITEDIDDLEVRGYFEGTGHFKLESIKIMDRVESLYMVVGCYDVLMLVAFFCFRKCKRQVV